MLTLRQLAPLLQRTVFTQRFYARPPLKPATDSRKMKLVHEEMLRYISPTSNIRVISDIFIKVRSADVHEYPSGDAFNAQLLGGPVKNCSASMEVTVTDDNQNVEVVLKKLDDCTDFHCELAVPIKASLDISSKSGVNVSNMYGDVLKIKANKYVAVSDVKADRIEVETLEGNIASQGLLLGRQTKLKTMIGHIILDKLQGDEIVCKTDAGNITTACCYVESSIFETNSGNLDLRNIHKNTKIHVHRDGNLKMTGVHGNIKVHFSGNTMDLQLSELSGESYIKSNASQSSFIKISEEIENTASIAVNMENNDSTISLDTSLQHLTVGLHQNNKQFKWPVDQERHHKLQIDTKNALTLGKSSWSEMLRMSMGKKSD